MQSVCPAHATCVPRACNLCAPRMQSVCPAHAICVPCACSLCAPRMQSAAHAICVPCACNLLRHHPLWVQLRHHPLCVQLRHHPLNIELHARETRGPQDLLWQLIRSLCLHDEGKVDYNGFGIGFDK